MALYKLVLDKAPNFDEPEYIFQSDVADIARSLPAHISDVVDGSVRINDRELIFDSALTISEIKTLLRGVFSYHIGNVRYISLVKIKH